MRKRNVAEFCYITIDLPPFLTETIEKLAKRERVSVSSVVNRLLTEKVREEFSQA